MNLFGGERMNKMRVYEYAKKHNVSSKEVINKLKDLDIEVSNHMSTITDKTVEQLDQKFKKADSGSSNKEKTPRTSSNPNKNQDKGNRPNKENKNGKPQSQGQNKQRNNQSNSKGKGNNKRGNQGKHQNAPQEKKETPSEIKYSDALNVGDLAAKLNKDSTEIIKKLLTLGVMAAKNQDLDDDSIELICEEYGVKVEKEIVLEETDLENFQTIDREEDLIERPAIVTIMGHVDHGKTTLLDSIRDTKVTEGEAGGITQHIGAYQIEDKGKKVTFLDTPGHAAFTSMRSRGAQVTDISILVVAADDGVMPQTIEAINHAKAAEVPIIIAVNKMDKEGANPDRVMQELAEHNLVPEDWGGDTIFVQLSAVKREGIDDLLEMILLVSEVEELKANPNRNATGTVIEARLDKGRGSVATL